MIDRYSREVMTRVWQPEFRFEMMTQVEVAVAQVQGQLGIIPRRSALAIARKAKFQIERISEIEKTTQHDVIAFVTNLAENVGEEGRYLHFGLTSSDVLDTALNLQIREAHKVFEKSFNRLMKTLGHRVRQHKTTLCAGRTHGIHAEPTSFGLKLAGHFCEFERCGERIRRAVAQAMRGKLSGAVGTYSVLPPKVEELVCKKLRLLPETVATQVVPRDRVAEVILAFAQWAVAIERLAVELRHLQRSEVSEVIEGFQKGQKGSSAMPHKKNPISAENLTGISRVMRSYVGPALENGILWHERDISHSSVERVILPDLFILADYAADRMEKLLSGMIVNKSRMEENLSLSQGQIFSSHALLLLVKVGFTREEAYQIIQSKSHGLRRGQSLESALKKDKDIVKKVGRKSLTELFSGRRHLIHVPKIIQRARIRS